MDNNTLIIVLALATLGLGVAWGLWQRARTRRAEEEGRQSALSRNPEHSETRQAETRQTETRQTETRR